MGNIDLTVQQVSRAGIDLTDNSGLTTTDTFLVLNDGRTFLHFKKSGAGACTVTIVTPGTVDGLAIGERTITVPATTGDVMVGPFPREFYNDGNGKLAFTLSEVTGLTVAVASLGS